MAVLYGFLMNGPEPIPRQFTPSPLLPNARKLLPAIVFRQVFTILALIVWAVEKYF
jgi:hypothetical protein